jgi:transcriptional regulator with XRE-family HTH domain
VLDEYLPESAASQLKSLRRSCGISQRQLAAAAGVNASLVSRLERGRDARLSTWQNLFLSMGYRVRFEAGEQDEETVEFLREKADERRERQREGLCTGRRRF